LMPPAQREQDPWTGRYVPSRENTEDLAGPSRSVPGAFDEPTETAPGASDTVEAIEPIEILETTETTPCATKIAMKDAGLH
jgi:hypothetical protein